VSERVHDPTNEPAMLITDWRLLDRASGDSPCVYRRRVVHNE
jgi:hypothetical protein